MKTTLLRGSSLALISGLLFFSASKVEAYGESRNSKNNGKSSGITADDQKFNELDTRITAQIRKDIVAKDGMSTSGKNIKIISQNGNVTLNGEVSENWEREWIETDAKQVSEVRSVKNNLKAHPNSSSQNKEKDHVR